MNADQIAGGALERKRLDEWAVAYPGPTSEPFESRMKGGVFRGMQDLEKAKEYADKVSAFWLSCGVDAPVFVVSGPTSTTKCRFEVVDATCGYPVLYKKGGMSVPQMAEASHDGGNEYPRERG